MTTALYTITKRSLLILCLGFALLLVMTQDALASDYNLLTWDTFSPADGAKLTSTTANISVSVTDWDGLAEGSLLIYLDGQQVQAAVSYSDDYTGGG